MFSIPVVMLRLLFILIQGVFIIGVAPVFSRLFLAGADKKYSPSAPRSYVRVAVLLPFHREHEISIMRTARSITNQTYPPELITIYLLVENGDMITGSAIPLLLALFRSRGMNIRVIYTESSYIGKPRALNQALPHIKEEVIIIFDADDMVPENYISSAVLEIVNGAAAVTTKVYRVGNRLHSRFLALDTFIWYDIYLPVYMKLVGYAPMSGEGLTVRRDVLEKIGGFPESLTEDAYLTLELAKLGEKMFYLNSVFIIERSPFSFTALLKQRIRWFKGYYECITAIVKQSGIIGYMRTPGLLITYMGPIISMATTASYTILFMYLFGALFGINPVVNLIEKAISGYVYYLAAFMFFGGNLFITAVIIYHFSDTRLESYTPYIYLAFAYWYIIGLVAFVSLFSPRKWYKTERIHHATPEKNQR